jgi:hypothetical protein
VREVGGLANDPRVLDAADLTATVETREGVEPLDALVIIDCGGLCLVRTEHDDSREFAAVREPFGGNRIA